eukprot:11775724-Alexandrium_andersonii.AAC.1
MLRWNPSMEEEPAPLCPYGFLPFDSLEAELRLAGVPDSFICMTEAEVQERNSLAGEDVGFETGWEERAKQVPMAGT